MLFMIYFNKNLSYLRAEKSMTLLQIAKEMNFSSSQWSNYEHGISYPKFLDLIKISKYFNVSETDLIHEDLECQKLIEMSRDLFPTDTVIYNNELIIIQKKLIQILEEKVDFLNLKLKEHCNNNK